MSNIGPRKSKERRLRSEIVDIANFLTCNDNMFNGITITNIISKIKGNGISPSIVLFGQYNMPCKLGIPECPIDISMKISFQHKASPAVNANVNVIKARSLLFEANLYKYIYDSFINQLGDTEKIYNFVPYVKYNLCHLVNVDAILENARYKATQSPNKLKNEVSGAIRACFDRSMSEAGGIPPEYFLVLITERSSGIKLSNFTDGRLTDLIALNFTAQCLISTKISQEYNIKQNDMHSNNVLVDTSDNVISRPPLTYVTGNGLYNLEIPMNAGKLLFFDWDLAIYPQDTNEYLAFHYPDNYIKKHNNNKSDIYVFLESMINMSHSNDPVQVYSPAFQSFWDEINGGTFNVFPSRTIYDAQNLRLPQKQVDPNDLNYPQTWPTIDELLNFPYFDQIRINPVLGNHQGNIQAAIKHLDDIRTRILNNTYTCTQAEAVAYYTLKETRLNALIASGLNVGGAATAGVYGGVGGGKNNEIITRSKSKTYKFKLYGGGK